MAAVRSLTQNQMVDEVVARLEKDGWPSTLSDDAENAYSLNVVVKDVLAQLQETVLDEIEQGIPVNVVNVARLTVRYTPAKPKRWVYSPATDEEVLASAKPATIRVKARPTALAQSCAPSTRGTVGGRIAKAAIARSRKREKAARARAREAA